MFVRAVVVAAAVAAAIPLQSASSAPPAAPAPSSSGPPPAATTSSSALPAPVPSAASALPDGGAPPPRTSSAPALPDGGAPPARAPAGSPAAPAPLGSGPPGPPPPPPGSPPPAAPRAPTPSASPPPTIPTTPIDPTTGNPLPLLDETGQPIILVDATGQPIVLHDATGQLIVPQDANGAVPVPQGDSLLHVGFGVVEPDERGFRASGVGATDYHAHAALVEGYNTNVLQTQDHGVTGPATQHPSLFTGLDLGLDLITWTTLTDRQDFRLAVRGQVYTPSDGNPGRIPPLDGTAIAALNRTFTLGQRTVLNTGVGATLTSSNSALLEDGALFQLDPAALEHVYTVETAHFSITHQLKPLWRVMTGLDLTVQGTLSEAGIVGADGVPTAAHTGLDYVNTGFDLGVAHDFDPRNAGTLTSRTQFGYVPSTINYGTAPPTYVGTTTNLSETVEAGWTHAYDEHFRSAFRVGAAVTQPPPLDPSGQVIVSPTGQVLLTYTKNYWLAQLQGSYSYGSANPRLGFGPAAGGGLEIRGIPYAHRIWNRLSMLVSVLGNRAQFLQQGGIDTSFDFFAASAELRWSVNNWLGLVGGYNAHYAVFEGAAAPPALLRHIVFVGLSGYFSSDKSLPTLETFSSPATAL